MHMPSLYMQSSMTLASHFMSPKPTMGTVYGLYNLVSARAGYIGTKNPRPKPYNAMETAWTLKPACYVCVPYGHCMSPGHN